MDKEQIKYGKKMDEQRMDNEKWRKMTSSKNYD
jgi:hypothetical protein